MPLLSFSVLKEKLLDGSKTQTIRLPRKRPLKVRDHLYIYWKCRTKETEKLGESMITDIQRKTISELTIFDAERDGFEFTKPNGYIQSPLTSLHVALRKMHPKMTEGTWVDVITFAPISCVERVDEK